MRDINVLLEFVPSGNLVSCEVPQKDYAILLITVVDNRVVLIVSIHNEVIGCKSWIGYRHSDRPGTIEGDLCRTVDSKGALVMLVLTRIVKFEISTFQVTIGSGRASPAIRLEGHATTMGGSVPSTHVPSSIEIRYWCW